MRAYVTSSASARTSATTRPQRAGGLSAGGRRATRLRELLPELERLDAAGRHRALGRSADAGPVPGLLPRLDPVGRAGAGQGRGAGGATAGGLRRRLSCAPASEPRWRRCADERRRRRTRWSRRCCSPPPGRSAPPTCRAACPRAPTSAARWRPCAPATQGRGVELECVADRWRFRTARRPRLPDDRGAGGAAPAVQGRAWRPWPSSPTTSRCTRAEIEAVRGVQPQPGHAGPAAGDGLGADARPPALAGPAGHLRHHRRASWSTSAWPVLADLPGAAEMKAAGLLDLDLPADFAVPDPAEAGRRRGPAGRRRRRARVPPGLPERTLSPYGSALAS